MITVEEIMTTAVYTLKENDNLKMAWQLMTENNIRHVPIVCDQGTLVGLVTHRDLLAASIPELADVPEAQRRAFEWATPLKQIMSTELYVVSEKMSLREAALHLQAHKYGCLPVVSKGKLRGIVTDSDFVAVAINLLEQLEYTEPVDSDFSDEPL